VKVMQLLNLTIPPFIITRQLTFQIITADSQKTLKISQYDVTGTPCSFIIGLELFNSTREVINQISLEENQTIINLELLDNYFSLGIYFVGHYHEPPIFLELSPLLNTSPLQYKLSYQVSSGKWSVFTQNNEEIPLIQIPLPSSNSNPFPTPNQSDSDPIREEGWAIDPITDCPHLSENIEPKYITFESTNSSFPGNGCAGCHSLRENWYCLKCSLIFCGRHVKGHGLDHFQKVGHCILVSFTDLSFWCYRCDNYISHDDLDQVLFGLHYAKFKKHHPKYKTIPSF